MRVVKESQKKLGEVDISKIKFNLRCRDEMPKLLMGLQHIYCTPELREKVFKILKDMIPAKVDSRNGRPGMELWKILVLGTVRLVCNWNFDKLHDIVNNHLNLREMLGHGLTNSDETYALQTLIDNVSLFTPEILDRVNQVVVEAGHSLHGRKKKTAKNERGRRERKKI